MENICSSSCPAWTEIQYLWWSFFWEKENDASKNVDEETPRLGNVDSVIFPNVAGNHLWNENVSWEKENDVSKNVDLVSGPSKKQFYGI